MQKTSTNLISQILERFNTAAPILHTLIISSVAYTSAVPPAPLCTELPENAFPEGAPHLRILELRSCSLRWHSPLLACDLTSLTLGNFLPAAQVSIPQVIATLGGMPNLELLELASVIVSSPSRAAIPPPLSCAYLPYLTRLRVEADIYSCASLLSYLDYPALKYSKVIWTCPITPESHFPSTFPSFHELGRNLAKGLKRSIYCLQASGRWGLLQIWDSPGAGSSLPCEEAQFEVHRSLDMMDLPADLIRKAMAEVWSTLPLHDLKILRFDSLDLDLNAWIDGFANLPNLENIHFRHTNSPTGLIDALSKEKGEELGGGDDDRLTFRSLRRLTIDGAAFNDQVRSSPPQTYLEKLVECLRERLERGRILREIHIENCFQVNDEVIGVLDDVVGKVDWDGFQSSSGGPQATGNPWDEIEDDDSDFYVW